jgi:hypothetical protein
MSDKKEYTGPRVLVLDVETKPILAYVWDIWEQNIPLNMIVEDWCILSWSAKWLESEDKSIVYGPHRKIMYSDQRGKKKPTNDKQILKEIRNLMDEAHVVIGQNSKQFDNKKLKARFAIHGFDPPSPFKQYDTKIMMNEFAFTSKKLEHAAEILNKKFKKLKHSKFPGFSLWLGCMAGNKEAWKEMERYNNHDVLSTEELFNILAPWHHVDFNVYTREEGKSYTCSCGSDHFQCRGFSYTTTGKYQRYMCRSCGAWSRGKKNMLTKDDKVMLRSKA